MLNFRKYPHSGFTLLELLVVVLIIAILAGIALPQYRKAVAKAELAQLLDLQKAIASAQERYFLAQGKYAENISDLDIEVPNIGFSYNLGNGTFIILASKNFVLTYYPSQANHRYSMGCLARNKTLSSACEILLDKTTTLQEDGACMYIGGSPCYAATTRRPL